MRKILNSFLIIFSLLFFSNVSADSNAEGSKTFIEKLGKEVIETVSDEKLSDSQRRSNFRYLYLNAFDNFTFQDLFLEDIGKELISLLRRNLSKLLTII